MISSPLSSFRILASLLALFLLCTGSSFAQEEHPEHPKEGKEQEKALTIDEFADAAKSYIQKRSEKNDGYFPVKDEKQGRTLKLELEKVHRKRLSHLGDNVYFVCADFKGKDGKLYDIDIFMKGSSKEDLKVTRDPMVHKVNGKARFTWYEKNGIWKRKKAGSSGEEHPQEEHPEHPDD
ncbi:MAG: hypothetical protein ABEH38_07935 [Flavobacteriales bacterium]